MKIKQEQCDFVMKYEKVEGTKYFRKKRIKGVQKYHISNKGTARLNGWFEHYKKIPFIDLEHIRTKEIEVKRIVENGKVIDSIHRHEVNN